MEKEDLLEKQPLHVPKQDDNNFTFEMVKNKVIAMFYYFMVLLHACLFILMLDKPMQTAAKDDDFHRCMFMLAIGCVSAIFWPITDALLLFLELILLLPHKKV